ncbi:Fic family protein [Paenibacillus sp. WC2504]|uniref:Fic family protein n=1 Tax=Paenibacillus sp. WC2504 TaxID=3461403 RepID=UPI004045ACC5
MVIVRFVYIHPFSDGNGRTASLLMNLILMKFGFPPAIVKAANEARLKYYETLELASISGDQAPFVQLIAGCVEKVCRDILVRSNDLKENL